MNADDRERLRQQVSRAQRKRHRQHSRRQTLVDRELLKLTATQQHRYARLYDAICGERDDTGRHDQVAAVMNMIEGKANA